MNLKRVKRMVPIQVGERTAYEVDRDGKWLISWGTGNPVDSPDCLLQQVVARLTPVRAIVNVLGEREK